MSSEGVKNNATHAVNRCYFKQDDVAAWPGVVSVCPKAHSLNVDFLCFIY